MTSRPKRQTKKAKKYDDDEYEVPSATAVLPNMRRVYRLLKQRDVKPTLKDTEVHILWPDNGIWYLAEVLEFDAHQKTALVVYPETHEEEWINLVELVQEKCIAVVEHVPLASKLRRGVEIPYSADDAAGAQFETDSEEEEQQDAPPPAAEDAEGAQQQPRPAAKAATPKSAPGKKRQQQQQPGDGARADDSDFEMSSDDSGAPSDDEMLDSDAMVSDDHPPSDMDSETSDELPLAFKQRSGSASKQSSGASGRKPGSSAAGPPGVKAKLNTPNKQQQRAVKGPLSPVGHPQISGVGGGQQVLGKRRVSQEGASEAKRHAGASAADAAAAAAAGGDSFKDAMLRKLLAKKTGGEADAATPAAASTGSAAGGRDRHHAPAAAQGSSTARQSAMREQRHQQQQQRLLEGRLSGSQSLQRAMSDHDVRQKAAGQLLVGLQRAVQEAQDKHKQQHGGQAAPAPQQQQQQQPAQGHAEGQPEGVQPAAAAAGEGSADLQQQQQQQAEGGVQQQAGQEQQQGGAAAGAAGAAAAGGVPPLVLPNPQELAETIETELFKLCGSINADYKSKLRTLSFNLKDPNNPDLRAHVLMGDILPSVLVTMSAADLASKDVAEFRRKVEEEHNKAIELDLEAAAKFSTAAAWATREDHLRVKEAALMGILAQPGGARKAATPPPGTPPPPGAEGAAEGEEQQQPDSATAAAAAGAGSGLLSAGSMGSEKSGRAEGMDIDDDAPYNPTEEAWGVQGGSTPTRPASEEPDAGAFAAAAAAAGGGAVGDSDQLPPLLSEQLSNQQAGGTAAAAAGGSGDRLAPGDSLTSTPSLSLGGGGGSVAGTAPGGLQHLGSITSKTTGGPAAAAGPLAGINWAAIKSEALKAAPVPPPAAAAKKQAAVSGRGADDDEPYNPEEEDEQPYDPTEGVQDGPPPSAAAAGGNPSSTDATAAGFADVPDMLPVVCARPPDAPPGPAPGQLVWHGCFVVSAGSGSFFSAHVQQLGGMGEVGRMLGAPGSNVSIMGLVSLDKFAQFAEDLRSSRSRTISLGMVVVAPGAPAGEGSCFQDMLDKYGSKRRIGKLALAKEVEGYLVAHSDFVSRLLKSAWLTTPPGQQHLVPRQLPPNAFLLLVVHRKDYNPPTYKQHTAGPGTQPAKQQGAPQPPAPGGGGSGAAPDAQAAAAAAAAAADPRRRGGGADPRRAAAAAGGVPPPPPAPAAAGGAALPPPPPAASAPVSSAAAPAIDLSLLSGLAAALGLPGGGAPAAPGQPGPPPPAAAAAAVSAPPPQFGAPISAGPVSGDRLQMQQLPLGGPASVPGPGLGAFPGPPGPPGPPPSSGGPGVSPLNAPASGGAPAGLMAALQAAVGAAGASDQQQQQRTVDLRSLSQAPGAPGPEQMVFDLRQPAPPPPQQQQQQQFPPGPPGPPGLPGPPPPHMMGHPGDLPPPSQQQQQQQQQLPPAPEGPVIVLPPGVPIPPPGTIGIPEGAVFMTQDAATGLLIPVGPPPGVPPGPVPPPGGPPPGPVPPPGGPPPHGYGPPPGGPPPHPGFGPPPGEYLAPGDYYPPGMEGPGGHPGGRGPGGRGRWGGGRHGEPMYGRHGGPPRGRGGGRGRGRGRDRD